MGPCHAACQESVELGAEETQSIKHIEACWKWLTFCRWYCMFLNLKFVFWFKLHWSLLIRVQLPISLHCFRIGAKQARSHYLNWCWPWSLNQYSNIWEATMSGKHYQCIVIYAIYLSYTLPLKKTGGWLMICGANKTTISSYVIKSTACP